MFINLGINDQVTFIGKDKTMEYKGWKNKETWLVKRWYMNHMPNYFADAGEYHVEPNELEEALTYICEEGEALSQLPSGLLSDFIRTCWGEVDWHTLAEHLNYTLKDMEKESM
jgi:hypothetical protein